MDTPLQRDLHDERVIYGHLYGQDASNVRNQAF